MFNFRVSTSPSDVATATGMCDWSFAEDHLDSVQTQTGTMQWGRGDTERTQRSKEKGLSRDPENTSLWGWTSILHWTWKREPEWTDRTIFGKHYYLGSKFSYRHTNTRKDTLIRLDVGVPLLGHPRDTAGWLRAGRPTLPPSTRDSIPVSYGHLVHLS